MNKALTDVDSMIAEKKCVDRNAENTYSEINSFYPCDTSALLIGLINKYEVDHAPITVSFRQLVSWVPMGERSTHYIHSYPAKLLPQIGHFFLAAFEVYQKKCTVLDPFSGTGTVALEALLSGRNAYYVDSNPLARLIAKVKTTPVCESKLIEGFSQVKSTFAKTSAGIVPDVVNIKYWYDENVISELSRLKQSVDEVVDEHVRDVLRVTFSTVCRKVSRADPRLSVPVRKKEMSNDVNNKAIIDVFELCFRSNLKRLGSLSGLLNGNVVASCAGSDARELKKNEINGIDDGSVDLIITSPPYAGAQKYIRASSLNLGWLDLAKASELKSLENRTIGREHLPKEKWKILEFTGVEDADAVIKMVYEKNKLRASIISTYINEMRLALIEMHRVLKTKGNLVLVIGNNEVCGYIFNSSSYLAQIAKEIGFSIKLELIDEIKSRGLMTKRNRSASVITREWVIVFEKVGG